MSQVPEKPLLLFTREVTLSQGIVELTVKVLARSVEEADKIIRKKAQDGYFDDTANESVKNTEGWYVENIYVDLTSTAMPQEITPELDLDKLNVINEEALDEQDENTPLDIQLLTGTAIQIIWTVNDVLTVCPRLTREAAVTVLNAVQQEHDADRGITWDTFRNKADELFPEYLDVEEQK